MFVGVAQTGKVSTQIKTAQTDFRQNFRVMALNERLNVFFGHTTPTKSEN